MSEPKFTWGDSVLIVPEAETRFRPGQIGEVCAITEVDNNNLADHHHVSIGSYVYTIEYADGSDEEIPQEHLRPVPA